MDITDLSAQVPAPIIGETQKVTSEEGHVYEPWTDGWAIGFKVTHATTGEVRYVYLSPSSSDDPTGDSNVFVYTGEVGDPAGSNDGPIIFVDPFKD